MKLGRFRLGMRTIKTAIAVMLCILLFHFLDRGQPLIAALSAVFSLRQDLTTTLSFGRSRILGNSIGGGTAIFYFLTKQYFHHLCTRSGTGYIYWYLDCFNDQFCDSSTRD